MMLEHIRSFFADRFGATSADPGLEQHRVQLATAALLVEVARADRVQEELELDAIHWAIGRTFELSPEETNALIDLANEEATSATSYYEFTSLINQSFQPEEKGQIIEMLWRVAYASGQLDKYEEALVRKIAGLIHVPHQEFVATRLQVEEDRRARGLPVGNTLGR